MTLQPRFSKCLVCNLVLGLVVTLAVLMPRLAVADDSPPPRADSRLAEEVARQERENANRAREEARDRATPLAIKMLLPVGTMTATAGGLTALVTYLSYSKTTTRPQFESLRVYNTIGWSAMILGAGAVASFYVLRPSLPDWRKPVVSLGIDGVRIEGTF